MRILLIVLLAGLLLLLSVAVGTEVVALHRADAPDTLAATPPVLVRKAPAARQPRKSVRVLSHRAARKVFHPHQNQTPRS